MLSAPPLFGRRPYWAHRFGIASVLPTTRAEMEELGWDSCDVILVTGDAYVDHPSFGMALIGRLLEAHGFRVGILAQPDWRSPAAFTELGRPNVMWGVTGGNMDSMVNRYTSDRKVRSDDAYSPDGAGGLRPDRCTIVYSQRCRLAFADVPIVIGGIEASLRRIAHYDYWSDRVRASILLDTGADVLLFGNAERAIVEVAHRIAAGSKPGELIDLRGVALARTHHASGWPDGWHEINSTSVDAAVHVDPLPSPYAEPTQDWTRSPSAACSVSSASTSQATEVATRSAESSALIPAAAIGRRAPNRARTVIRLPSFEQVAADRVAYAHASRVLHLEANPGNARALVQRHGDVDIWINPPPVPLSTAEMDAVYELPYSRLPHPRYGSARIPAYEMIKNSITILRGCFGGCSFCSITEHEGRIIQSRSEASILREVEHVRDATPGFTGIISDLGGPTANMYRLACKSREVEAACRKPSCVFPDICGNLGTDHGPLVSLYRKARAVSGIRKVLIASGVRYDLAVRSPEWIRELAQHHTGGYLKIAPEHTEDGPLAHMMKPGIGTYDRFKALFDRYSQEAGKEQYLIPYFIAAHPGTTDDDMLALALWLKRNGFRPDQVQAFLPAPLATATAMYHTGLSPLQSLKQRQPVPIVKSPSQRRLHKAFLRYHDADNWPMLRAALQKMGRADLIGNGKQHLVPHWQPRPSDGRQHGDRQRSGPRKGTALTQHTGLPPAPLTQTTSRTTAKRPLRTAKRRPQ